MLLGSAALCPEQWVHGLLFRESLVLWCIATVSGAKKSRRRLFVLVPFLLLLSEQFLAEITVLCT
jgi:hypothetical protein